MTSEMKLGRYALDNIHVHVSAVQCGWCLTQQRTKDLQRCSGELGSRQHQLSSIVQETVSYARVVGWFITGCCPQEELKAKENALQVQIMYFSSLCRGNQELRIVVVS